MALSALVCGMRFPIEIPLSVWTTLLGLDHPCQTQSLSSEGTARFSDGCPIWSGTIWDGGLQLEKTPPLFAKGNGSTQDNRRIRRFSRRRESIRQRGVQRSLCTLVPSGRREPQLGCCERLWRRRLRGSGFSYDLGARRGSRKTSLPTGRVVPPEKAAPADLPRKTSLLIGRVVPRRSGSRPRSARKTSLPSGRDAHHAKLCTF